MAFVSLEVWHLYPYLHVRSTFLLATSRFLSKQQFVSMVLVVVLSGRMCYFVPGQARDQSSYNRN